MRISTGSVALAAAMLATTGIAAAQAPAKPAPPATRAEALAAADRRFDKLDTDRDGTLTRAEREAGRRHADKAMSREEWRAHATRRFERMDTNRDGRIDDAERAAFRAARR